MPEKIVIIIAAFLLFNVQIKAEPSDNVKVNFEINKIFKTRHLYSVECKTYKISEKSSETN